MTKPVAWVTWTLIALNVAMFGIELASGLDPIQPHVQDMLRLGANLASRTLGHHEWWRVVASMFLHYGVIHIAMNMICLAQASVVERMYGHAGFAAIYFASGIIGGVGSIAVHGNVVSAGASGAVFGVFGAFGAFLVTRRKEIDPLALRNAAQRLGTFIVINMIIGLQSKGIDVTAHFVGLVVGFLAGLAVPKLKALPTFAVSFAMAITALLTLPTPFSLLPVLDDYAQAEKRANQTYSANMQALKAKQLDVRGFGDVVEKEILPDWKALRGRRVDAVPDDQVVPKLRPLLGMLRRLVKDRQDMLEEAVAVSRDASRGNVALQAEGDRVKDDLAAYEAEIARLNSLQ